MQAGACSRNPERSLRGIAPGILRKKRKVQQAFFDFLPPVAAFHPFKSVLLSVLISGKGFAGGLRRPLRFASLFLAAGWV